MRESWSRLALVLGGLLVGFGLAEVAVRLLDVPPRMLDDPGTEIMVLADNPALRYRFKPNHRPPPVPPSLAITGRRLGNPLDFFTTNSLGFRDREFEVDRPAEVRRILALGDSITAGNGVADIEDVYTRRLEALLEARSGPERYQVYNMGVSGYETRQEVETLRVYGLRFEPDIVLVQFCLNDFSAQADGGVWKALKREVDPHEYRFWLSAAPALKRSRLAFVLYYRLLGLLGELRPPSIDVPRRPDVEGLALLDELAAEHGFRAIVFVMPFFDRQFSNYAHLDLHKRIRRRAARFPNVVLVDLLERFRRRPESVGELAVDGVHPSPKGHAAVAQMLVEVLEGLGELGGPPANATTR